MMQLASLWALTLNVTEMLGAQFTLRVKVQNQDLRVMTSKK
jgi:hypothetical protein